MSRFTWAAKTARFALLTTVFAVGGTGLAVAGTTTGSHSVAGGNQVDVPVNAPVTACGNSVSVAGRAISGCAPGGAASSASTGSASAHSGSAGGASANASTGSQTTSGSHSVLGGNQVDIPVNVPVAVCGNAAAVLGRAMSGCMPAASASSASAGGAATSSASTASQTTSGSHSVLGGNQV